MLFYLFSIKDALKNVIFSDIVLLAFDPKPPSCNSGFLNFNSNLASFLPSNIIKSYKSSQEMSYRLKNPPKKV